MGSSTSPPVSLLGHIVRLLSWVSLVILIQDGRARVQDRGEGDAETTRSF